MCDDLRGRRGLRVGNDLRSGGRLRFGDDLRGRHGRRGVHHRSLGRRYRGLAGRRGCRHRRWAGPGRRGERCRGCRCRCRFGVGGLDRLRRRTTHDREDPEGCDGTHGGDARGHGDAHRHPGDGGAGGRHAGGQPPQQVVRLVGGVCARGSVRQRQVGGDVASRLVAALPRLVLRDVLDGVEAEQSQLGAQPDGVIASVVGPGHADAVDVAVALQGECLHAAGRRSGYLVYRIERDDFVSEDRTVLGVDQRPDRTCRRQ